MLKKIDAEALKIAIQKVLPENEYRKAVSCIKEMQGYKKYYVYIVSRRKHGEKDLRTPDDIPDQDIHAIVSVVAKNESDARRRIKESGKVKFYHSTGWRSIDGGSDITWRWLSFIFTDEQTARKRVVDKMPATYDFVRLKELY